MNNIEQMIEDFKKNHYLESSMIVPNKCVKPNNIFEWGYIESPFFSDVEIEQLKNYYAESSSESYYDYFGESVPDMLRSKKKSYGNRVIELQNKLKSTDDPEECDQIRQQLIDIGWNPEIEYNSESQKMARDRFISLMNENVIDTEIIDITHLIENESDAYDEIISESKDNKLHPIHVVLVKGDTFIAKVISPVTHSDFTHAALALDCNFNKLYSYNMDNKINIAGGFSLEDVNEYPKENRLGIYTFFVNNETYKKIEDRLQYLLNNVKNTTYNIGTFLAFPFKHLSMSVKDSYICSEFVDSIMKIANMDITDIKSSKVSPGMLYTKSIGNARLYKTYDGPVKDLNQNKIKRFINKISKSATVSESVIIEARKFPIEVKDNGDILLTNPFVDFDAEYMNSHKLLIQYDKANNIEGMKYELARLYYMNYVLEKKLYHNNHLKDKDKNMKTRARVLNDFNKYIKVILKAEPNFNFAEYYQNSVFYPHTVEVKGKTIITLKNIIDYIL